MGNTDERLALELRALFDEVDAALERRPVSGPPWSAVQAFMGAARARRRRRLVVVVIAAALAVLAVFTAQNLLLGGGIERGQGSPAAPSFEKWDTTVGSLRGDQDWLADLRQAAASADPVAPEPDTASEPGTDVEVLYASDVGQFRIAVVRGRWPAIDGPQLVEYVGVRGARATQMSVGDVPGAPSDIGSVYRAYLTRDMLPTADQADVAEAAAAVVVLATGRAPLAQLQQPPAIAADGTITQRTRTLRFTGGAAQMAIGASGHYAIVMPSVMSGTDEYAVSEGYLDFYVGDVDPQAVETRPLRGGPERSTKALQNLAWSTWNAVRQPVDQGSWQVVAASEKAAGGQGTALVGLLTLPGGARVVAAGNVEDSDGTAWLDTARLLPAGADDDVSIAWRLDLSESQVQRSAAMGPVGTRSVEWTTTSGDILTTRSANTVATIDRIDVVSVRYLDAQGTQLGSDEVLEPQAAQYEAAEEPTTQEPDAVGSWQLPQIRDGLAGF